nr:reverse transcriptase domain-containing protein [Tanacetum cinerariifolium]
QDSLNAAAGGNLLERSTQDVLTIIENKSKVRNSRSKPLVSQVKACDDNSDSKIAKFTHAVNQQTSAVTTAMTAMLKQLQATPPPASVKAVKEICVTCGGAHPYYQCLAASGNTFPEFRDNIQGYVLAAAVNYNQGHLGYRLQGTSLSNQTNEIKNMMASLLQMNTASTSSSGTLPSNTIANPKGDLKAITTRSGVSYDGPLIPSPVVENEPEAKKDTVNPTNNETTKDVQPQREMAQTLLNERCSAVLLKKLPEKLGDPGKFLMPCDFPGMAKCLALTDVGASINLMPYSVWKKLSLPELTPTCMTLELADHSISRPVGVAEDVYVKVGSFHFLADFIVVDFDADPRVPLILRRSFLKTRRSLIDVFEGELTLRVGKEAITFNMDQTSRYSANYNDMTAKRIDVIDMACEEYSQELLGFSYTILSGNPTPCYDPIISATSPTLTLFENSDFRFEEVDGFLAIEDEPTSSQFPQSYLDLERDILLLKAFLNDDPSSPPPNQRNYLPEVSKELKMCEAKIEKYSVDEPPAVELKVLPLTSNMHSWKSLGQPCTLCTEKGGFIVVENEENELIPTRLVTSWRVCIDYRKLNEATRKDHFPLPFMDQMLERLAGNQYYCFLNGFSGYFQIPNDPKDQEKTTFTCPYGTFAFRRMPFGLCNALGTFQRCMMEIFHDMIEKTMEVFMDDFSVFGNSFQNCLSHLEKMLKRCEDTNLCLNWEKSHFMVKEGIILGHKISEKGIEVDKAKIDVISKLPHPSTVKGIRSFLGHAECIDAFQTLKRMLTETPILIAPDWDMPFELMCDAIGAVLGQRRDKHFWPIHYASKTMTEAESKYTTTEKEMLAVVYAFEKFRSYLILNKSIVYTDHSALKYMFLKKDSKARLLRWVLLLQEFTFKVVDTKGAKNLAADHLFRLENPHQNVLDPKEINESFPLETLNLVSSRGSQSTSWFADFANYHAGNFIVKGMTSQQKNNFFKDVKHYFWDDLYLSALIKSSGGGQMEVSNRGLIRILKRAVGEGNKKKTNIGTKPDQIEIKRKTWEARQILSIRKFSRRTKNDSVKLEVKGNKEKDKIKTKPDQIEIKQEAWKSPMSAKDKSGLGYESQIHDGVLSYENEVFASVFDSRNYMPPKFNFGIDESKFTYGPKKSKTSESNAKNNDLDSCDSNSSAETLESVPKPIANEPKAVSEPKVWSDASIIEEYEQTVKEQHTCSQNLKPNNRDWDGLMSKRMGLGYGFTKKVCGNFSHLIRDCDFHEKRMAKQIELTKQKGNKAYLVYYQDFHGGPVAFRGSKGQITGKDTECLVLSPDFKLPDENQVLLKVPRQQNMYSFNLENIVPSESLKATIDESTKWHRGAATTSSTNFVITATTPLNAASTPTNQDDSQILALEDIYDHSRDGIFTSTSYDDEGAMADFTNLESTMHGHRQEEGIDYDEVFAPVARIEAIRIFLAFASYMGFIFYQMDVKSTFLYGKTNEDVTIRIFRYQAAVEEGEDLGTPTESQPTPSPTQPSAGDQPPLTESSLDHDPSQDLRVNLEGIGRSREDQVKLPYDSPLSSGYTSNRAEGSLNLEELFALCTNLSNRVLALENVKNA